MMDMEVVKYDVTEAAISEMRSIYMELTVKDIDDDEGFKIVHDARMVVKGKRVAVEKQRKEYKESALKFGRMVDAEAKKIFSALEPIESHLQEQENIVANEKKRIAEEKLRAEKERTQKRVNELASVGCMMGFFEVAALSTPEYEKLFFEKKTAYEAEQTRIAEEKRAEAERLEKERVEREAEKARLAAEKAEFEKQQQEVARIAKIKKEIDDIKGLAIVDPNKTTQEISNRLKKLIAIEINHEIFQEFTPEVEGVVAEATIAIEKTLEQRRALAAERAELERIRKEQADREAAIRAEQEAERARLKAEQDKIDAEKRAIEAAKRKEQERIEREAFEKQAAENARIAAEKAAKEKAEREAAEKAEAERLAKEEAERQEALRPDREKIQKYAVAITAIPFPVVSSPAAESLVTEIKRKVVAINRYILTAINEM